MSFIGNVPAAIPTSFQAVQADSFNGNGSTTDFTLSRKITNLYDIEVLVDNVQQSPYDGSYSVSGTTITFSSAPGSGTNNIYIVYRDHPITSIRPKGDLTLEADLNVDGTVYANTTLARDGGSDATINGVTPTSDNLMGRNRIQNGDMRIDQRNAGASVTPNGAYTLDRWVAVNSQTGKFSVQQVTDAPAGFTNSLKITSLSTYSIVSGDYFDIAQSIEGFNIADLNWGSANAKTVTLSFWTKSSLTGTFGGVIRNATYDYNYPFTYTISAANTWEYKTVTITGATSGTWNTTNGIGASIWFGLGVGATYSGTAGAWGTLVGASSATGATSVVGTNGATFYLTGVQLEAGSVATSFERVDYGEMLSRCQRYYQKFSGNTNVNLTDGAINVMTIWSTTSAYTGILLPTPMRTAPTLSYSALSDFYFFAYSNIKTPTVIYYDGGNINRVEFYITWSGGLTAGYSGWFRINNTAGWLAFSSEL